MILFRGAWHSKMINKYFKIYELLINAHCQWYRPAEAHFLLDLLPKHLGGCITSRHWLCVRAAGASYFFAEFRNQCGSMEAHSQWRGVTPPPKRFGKRFSRAGASAVTIGNVRLMFG